jgi:hypothetical protein
MHRLVCKFGEENINDRRKTNHLISRGEIQLYRKFT